MQNWIDNLVAFVKNDTNYSYGTKAEQEMKMATPEAQIEIRPDPRWDELVRLGEIFGKSPDK